MELRDEVMKCMSIGAVFKDGGRVSSLDFHRTEDLLVTASADSSIRLYDTANATPLKAVYSLRYGVDQICFTHHANSVVYSSKNHQNDHALRYLSLYDNRYLRYFKGHKDRVLSLCMSPKNDCFMSASLDHTVRLWDLRSNVCQGLIRLRGRPSVAYDQQGLVFAVSMEGGAIKLFDVRSFDKGPFDTFLVGGDTVEIAGMKFSNDGKMMLLSTINGLVYLLDAYSGKMMHGFRLKPAQQTLEASFSPDGRYVISGSGDGSLRAWSTVTGAEVACWTNNAGVPAAIKWAPRRLMFATGSIVLSLWIPDTSKLTTS